MDLDLREAIQRPMFWGTYSVHETGWVRRILRRGDTFIDVGANIGHFTLVAAECVGKAGRVVAIEANTHLAGKLRTAVSTVWPQVEIVPVAISAGAPELTLWEPELAYGNENLSIGAYIGVEHMTQRIVPAMPLEEIAERHGLRRIRMAKIDVEGAEPDVIVGGERLFRDGVVETLLIEVNSQALAQRPRDPWTAQQLVDRLVSLGYEIRETTGHLHAHGCDMLLVHRGVPPL